MTDVATLIADQSAAIDATMAQADSFLDRLLNVTDIELSTGLTVAHVPVAPTGPNFNPVTVSAPSGANSPPFVASPPSFSAGSASPIAIPSFDVVSPEISFPAAPNANLPNSPGASPSFNLPNLPSAPSTVLPPIPTFEALSFPLPPSIDLPRFGGIVPTDDLIAPTTQFEYFEELYASALLDELKAKLLDSLQNGGYGIETADEIALFNRERDREIEAMLSRIEDAGRAMASRGFPLPPGELSIHVDRAYQDMQNKVSSASRDIALKRADMYVENRKFTIEQTKALEQILIGFHNSIQERSLNVAKSTVEMAVTIFNALVGRFNARLDAYKAQAAVFADLIRGELAKIEIYRTEVEAKGVEVQARRQLVELYLAQIKSVEMAVDIFRVQMDAARVEADIERLKLEAFRSEVEAYTAQVQAKVAEFGLYRARVDGEKAKADVFDSQVRGFIGQVTAAKAQADVSLGNLQAQTEIARAQLAGYQATVSGHEANVRSQLEANRISIAAAEVAGVNAKMANDANVAMAGIIERSTNAAWQANIGSINALIESARVNLLAKIESLKARVAGAEFASTKFFALLSAMEGTINTLAVQTATE